MDFLNEWKFCIKGTGGLNMEKKTIVFLLILSLFLTSCSGNDDLESSELPAEESDLNNRMLVLEAEVETMDKRIEEINNDNNVALEEGLSKSNEYINRTNMLFHLIETLPSVTVKEGYIVDYTNENDNQYFIIDYAELLDDEEAPNGFRIDNETVENNKVIITENLELYIGEHASDPNFPSKVEWEPKEMDLEDIKQGFYKFYFIEDELIMVLRTYIP